MDEYPVNRSEPDTSVNAGRLPGSHPGHNARIQLPDDHPLGDSETPPERHFRPLDDKPLCRERTDISCGSPPFAATPWLKVEAGAQPWSADGFHHDLIVTIQRPAPIIFHHEDLIAAGRLVRPAYRPAIRA